jgi:hypothetical protein
MNNKKWPYLPERIKAKIREVQKFLLELNYTESCHVNFILVPTSLLQPPTLCEAPTGLNKIYKSLYMTSNINPVKI